MPNLATVEAEALQLPIEGQQRLAQTLNENVLGSGMTDVEKAWMPILEKRYQRYLEDPSTAIPMEQAMRELREELD